MKFLLVFCSVPYPGCGIPSNLGLWLEYHYKLNPVDKEFIFGLQVIDNPIQVNESVSKMLSDLIDGEWSSLSCPGILGSPTVRMLTVTHCISSRVKSYNASK